MKKKISLILIATLVCVVMVFSLTACLRIAMQEKSIIERLSSAGAVLQNARKTPITTDITDLRLDNVYTAQLVSEDDGSVSILYLFFCQDKNSADKTEAACSAYMAEHSEDCANWSVYRYEEIVMCGDFNMVTIARSY